MTLLEGFRPEVADNGLLLLPEHPPRLGPVSRRLIARTGLLLAAQIILGSLMVFLSSSDRVRAIGLGLVFPGAGFLFSASPIGLLVTLAVMVLAVVLWWGISAHFGIPLVWWGSALLAGVLVDGPRVFTDRGTTWGWAIPAAYLAGLAVVALVSLHYERRYHARLAQVPELNRYLAATTVPGAVTEPIALGDVDRELVRWAYDLALQPLDRFEGFDWGEQIHGPTCVRYQLDFLTWALALHAVNHVPNAPATVERAMAALIERQTDIRVWGYWRTLNRIGNFRNDPDPILHDNIMFSAFLLETINMYEAATGDDRFDAEDGLTFVWKDGRTFTYGHERLAQAVHRNVSQSELGLFPCEPGWVFTACNTFAAQGLAGHARHHGSHYWADVHDHWRRGLEQEMLTPDGNFLHIRSKLTGLSFDTGEVPGGQYFTTGTNGFVDVAPDLAARGKALALRGVDARLDTLATHIRDGVLDLELTPAPERNTGIATSVPEWTGLIGATLAAGRRDVATAAIATASQHCGTGGRWPDRPLTAGVQNTGIHMVVRWGTPMSTGDLAIRGYRAPEGPVLANDLWPALLVTEARAPEPATLEVTVEPGLCSGNHRFELEHLRPEVTYVVESLSGRFTVRADSDGRAAVDVPVAGLTRVRIAPEPAA